MNFILKFSRPTLLLNKKNYNHRITATETLNSDTSDLNQCYSELEPAATAHVPTQLTARY